MSWFTTETICPKCSEEEDEFKNKMRKRGLNPDKYEGCGKVIYERLKRNMNR
jgi:hypothetical protein